MEILETEGQEEPLGWAALCLLVAWRLVLWSEAKGVLASKMF